MAHPLKHDSLDLKHLNELIQTLVQQVESVTTEWFLEKPNRSKTKWDPDTSSVEELQVLKLSPNSFFIKSKDASCSKRMKQ